MTTDNSPSFPKVTATIDGRPVEAKIIRENLTAQDIQELGPMIQAWESGDPHRMESTLAAWARLTLHLGSDAIKTIADNFPAWTQDPRNRSFFDREKTFIAEESGNAAILCVIPHQANTDSLPAFLRDYFDEIPIDRPFILGLSLNPQHTSGKVVTLALVTIREDDIYDTLLDQAGPSRK